MQEPNAHRQRLLRWMDAALGAVDPAARVAAALQRSAPERAFVLALGKAAARMAAGAERALGDHITGGMVIAPLPPESLPERWRFRKGGHPVPDGNSLQAGQAMETALQDLEPGIPLLVLLSGGASALAELPVEGLALSDLQRVNRWLLGSGLDIHSVNAVRARFSRLKRGGLLRLAGARKVSALVISDVPGDRVADIASGPLSPQAINWPDIEIPAWLARLHARLPVAPVFESAMPPDIRLVACNADSLDAVEHRAGQENVPLVLRETLSGDAGNAGREVGRRLRGGPPGLYLFGGETSVRLPAAAGLGGRNQHLALAGALEISGDENLFLLAVDSDGIDGNTGDAGALVDGGTVGRIRDEELDPAACLAMADSNSALAAAGDVIQTGPTGTNVADIVIGLRLP